MENPKLNMRQRKAIAFLCNKYANGGARCSRANDGFFKAIVAQKEDDIFRFSTQITPECRAAFERILANNFMELSKACREVVMCYPEEEVSYL